jgi:CO/xanthine dehydrogenase FAD-binding subunit
METELTHLAQIKWSERQAWRKSTEKKAMLNLTEYHRPGTVDEAVSLLTRKMPKTVALGGGTWLNGEGALGNLKHVEAVVDVAALGLNRIEVDTDPTSGEPKTLRIGAAITHQTLVEHELTSANGTGALRVLGLAAECMSGLNIRNRATIAGAVCTADESSPLVTALLALDAAVIMHGQKNGKTEEKSVSISGLLSYRNQILGEGYLITEIQLPYPSATQRGAFEKVARTPNDYPIVCVTAVGHVANGTAWNIHVAVGGINAFPLRLNELRFALERKTVAAVLDTELNNALANIHPQSDFRGSGEYRIEMARILIGRAIARIGG